MSSTPKMIGEELTSEERKQKAEQIVSKWTRMQKTIKEEITLDEIVLQHMKTQHASLIESYHYFYWSTIKARESSENIDLILQNNFKYLHYEISPDPDRGLKDAYTPSKNLMFFFRENFEYTLELFALIEDTCENKTNRNFIHEIEEREMMTEEQIKQKEKKEKIEKEETNKKIDSIINLFCHQMYNNILIPNPEQEELMILIFVLLAKRVGKLEVSAVKGFLDEETVLGKFLKSFTKKPEVKFFLSKTLNNIINSIDRNEERCLHLNPLFIKKRIIEKKRRRNTNVDENITEEKIDKLLNENIPMSSLHFEEETKCHKQKTENNSINEVKKKFYHFDQNKDQLLLILKQKEEDENVRDVMLNHLNCLNVNPNLYGSKMLYTYFFKCERYLKETAEEYKAGYKFYITAIDEILQQFFDKISTVPYPIRCLCKIIHTLISKKFPKLKNYQKNAFIGEFIFGKCLLPILDSSTSNDVLSSIYLKSKTTYFLKNVAKIIKHIYRGELFTDERDPGFTYFNSYILQAIPFVNLYLQELIKVDLPNVLNSYLKKHIDSPSLSAFKLRKVNTKKEKEPIVYDFFKEHPEEYIDIKFICFCIDDILFLHEIISQNVERFKGLYKYNFFRKTIERIGDMTDRLKQFLATPNEYSFDDVLKAEKIEISEKENLIKKEEELPHYKVNGPFAKNAKFFYLVFKEYEKNEDTVKKINGNCPLVHTNNEEKILEQMKFCLKTILSSINIINIKDYPRLGNAVTNREFFLSLEQTLADLEEEIPSSDKVPLKWYAQFLSECSKMEIVNKNNDDFNTIYTILQKQEEDYLQKLRIENTSVLTKRGMNIRCAEKIIEKVYKENLRMLKVKGYKKMQKFSEITNIEACITFKSRDEVMLGKANEGAIIIEDGKKCIHQKMKTLQEVSGEGSKQSLKEVISKKKEHHAETVKNLIEKIKEYNLKENLLSEDILFGHKDSPVVKLNNTMERYKILVKQCIDKSEIFIEDTKEEKKRTLVQIQDYILKQLYSETFPPEAGERAINVNEAELQLPQKDKQLYDKLQKINDIRPEELLVKLDLPEKQINDSINIMKKLDEANSVYEKVSCIHWAYNMISLLLHFITGKEEAGGADDISPIFQYIVIKAKPKRVFSNIAYIRSTLNLEGQYNFIVAQMEYSAEFLTNFKRII